MDYKEDLKKFQKAFNEMPVYGKLFIIGNFLISVMSLASLSQNIVDFYGFLSEGVHFYRVTTQFLFYNLISYLNLTQPKLDALVLLSIVTLTLIRYQFKSAPELIILDVWCWFFISREIIKSSSELSFHPVIAAIFVVGCSAALPLIFSRLKANQGVLVYHRASISLIFTFISVCVVAAISNALAKIFA